MSQRAGLSPLELLSGPDRVSVAQAIAAELLERNRNRYGSMEMRLQADPDAGDEDDDDEDDGDKDGGNTGGAGGDAKDTSSEGDPSKKISALEEEKDRHFRARQEAEAERDRLKAEAEERQRAENDEVTNLKNDVDKYKGQVEELSSRLEDALLDNAFLTDNSFQWHNPKMVLKNIDREGVTIDKDGKVSGVADAIKKLAEDNPWMLKSKEGSDKDDDKDDKDDKQGPPSGSQRNGKKIKGEAGKYKKSDLQNRYPALRR